MSSHVSLWHEYILFGCLQLDTGPLIVFGAVSTATANTILQDEIGSDGFDKVVKGTPIPTGEKVAIKIIDKIQLFLEPLNLRRVKSEIN